MTVATLWFRRADVLDLAEHAMAAADHQPDPYDESETRSPSLIWVKDDGIYLVSNGMPRQVPTATDHPTSKMHVVCAHGHDRGTHWHHGPPLDDDFIEYLPLTGSVAEDSTPLIDLLRDTGTDPATWLVIIVHSNIASIELRDTGPS